MRWARRLRRALSPTRLAFLLTCLTTVVHAQDPRIILLGTGTPNPEPAHSGPAVAVVSGKNVYTVDSGPGIVRRAAQAGITMDQLTRAFITHLHSDHTIGLPDLIFTPAVTGRKEPLEIYGPPGLGSMVAHIMRAWKEDVNIRLHGLEPAVKNAYIVHAHDTKTGEVYRDTAVTVRAFEVAHGSWKHAYGYRFDIGGKSVVISGDTSWSDNLISAARGCDVLIHEFYSQKGWEGRTPEWRRYHAAFHISAVDLGKLAAQVKPGKLVLYHELPMGQTPDEVLSEVRQNFNGEVIYGNDLDVIPVGK